MITYGTYKTSQGTVTVEHQKQRTRDTEYKDVIYSNIGGVITYDEYSPTRLTYLLGLLSDRRKK